jgi:NAD(P)-dependent dehydrogenase (short-subunit alcohol dehydrogenase family)
MTDEKRPISTVDQLPDDSMSMPPPYWRGSGAIFHLSSALQELASLLHQLILVHTETELRLDRHFEKYPEQRDDDEDVHEKFADIADSLWALEHRIKLKAELTCLMSAIQSEDDLNQFCVFNLPKDTAESIEKLSPTEKLLVASAACGSLGVKGKAVFEAIRKLVTWRNAFAHGHCVDRPTKSLRHNHLISPDEYPGVPSELRDTIDLVSAFLLVHDHLRAISLNPYTRGKSLDVEEITQALAGLKRFTVDGNSHVYTIAMPMTPSNTAVNRTCAKSRAGRLPLRRTFMQTDSFVLKNQKIVVVGGGSGIGYAVAQKAVNAGAEVVIASRSLEKLQAAAERLGVRVRVEQVDASDAQPVINFFHRVGPFDHLAATIKPQLPSGRFLENEVAIVHAAFEAKFWGQYQLAKHGAQYIRPNGSIVLTSGIASHRSYLGYSAVSAMNAAIETLSKAIAIELAPIRVNTVCPGFVDTEPPIPARAQHVKMLAPTLPLNRLGAANEVAEAYLYLFGNPYSTGSVVVVDGGALC